MRSHGGSTDDKDEKDEKDEDEDTEEDEEEFTPYLVLMSPRRGEILKLGSMIVDDSVPLAECEEWALANYVYARVDIERYRFVACREVLPGDQDVVPVRVHLTNRLDTFTGAYCCALSAARRALLTTPSARDALAQMSHIAELSLAKGDIVYLRGIQSDRHRALNGRAAVVLDFDDEHTSAVVVGCNRRCLAVDVGVLARSREEVKHVCWSKSDSESVAESAARARAPPPPPPSRKSVPAEPVAPSQPPRLVGPDRQQHFCLRCGRPLRLSDACCSTLTGLPRFGPAMAAVANLPHLRPPFKVWPFGIEDKASVGGAHRLGHKSGYVTLDGRAVARNGSVGELS